MSRRKVDGGSTRGIPENLVPLAKQGKRVRFSGGWLGDTPQDRYLADWIDNQSDAWTAIKTLLFAVLSGGGINVSRYAPEQPRDTSGAAASALMELDD